MLPSPPSRQTLVLMDISLPGMDGITTARAPGRRSVTGPLADHCHVGACLPRGGRPLSRIRHECLCWQSRCRPKPCHRRSQRFCRCTPARESNAMSLMKDVEQSWAAKCARRSSASQEKTLASTVRADAAGAESGDRKTLLQRAHAAYSSASAAGFADLCGKLSRARGCGTRCGMHGLRPPAHRQRKTHVQRHGGSASCCGDRVTWPRLSRRHREEVAFAVRGDDDAWMARIVLQLLPEPTDHHIDCAVGGVPVTMRDFVQQPVPRQDLAGIGDENRASALNSARVRST